MLKKITFGKFISKKRKEKDTSLRQTAKFLGISAEYLSSLETGKKTNPNIEILQKIVAFLNLDETETALFYDLQAEANGTVSHDLTEYIMRSKNLRKTLRTAKKNSVTDEEWAEYFHKLFG